MHARGMPAGAIAFAALLTACSGGTSSQQNIDYDGGAATGSPAAAAVSSPASAPPGATVPSLPPSAPATVPESGAPTASPAATPPTIVNVGNTYEFHASGSTADGDTITFDIANIPPWATFDPASGELSGTPTPADVGIYSDIVISVSDGPLDGALPPFSITVTPVGTETATLNWIPPTENVDGSPLPDLAGYRVLYGTSSGGLNLKVQLTNPGLSSFVVDNLSPGIWYFALTAYTSTGAESESSNIVSKMIH